MIKKVLVASIFNFSAGPAMLPEADLKQAAEEMVDYRASIYNAMPIEGVSKLVNFMASFEKTKG